MANCPEDDPTCLWPPHLCGEDVHGDPVPGRGRPSGRPGRGDQSHKTGHESATGIATSPGRRPTLPTNPLTATPSDPERPCPFMVYGADGQRPRPAAPPLLCTNLFSLLQRIRCRGNGDNRDPVDGPGSCGTDAGWRGRVSLSPSGERTWERNSTDGRRARPGRFPSQETRTATAPVGPWPSSVRGSLRAMTTVRRGEEIKGRGGRWGPASACAATPHGAPDFCPCYGRRNHHRVASASPIPIYRSRKPVKEGNAPCAVDPNIPWAVRARTGSICDRRRAAHDFTADGLDQS
jgi:hypothetical protein